MPWNTMTMRTEAWNSMLRTFESLRVPTYTLHRISLSSSVCSPCSQGRVSQDRVACLLMPTPQASGHCHKQPDCPWPIWTSPNSYLLLPFIFLNLTVQSPNPDDVTLLLIFYILFFLILRLNFISLLISFCLYFRIAISAHSCAFHGTPGFLTMANKFSSAFICWVCSQGFHLKKYSHTKKKKKKKKNQ
jgi:hypothetical protein